ncbi:coronin-2A [Colossoma macropomum]|uniref:coronin-2A n=1 Tax=Colossoma macropomum TaxID=42526 RepID=UPI001864BEAC|nr:coronin-2A [Colossoma macropomum]
MTTTLPVQTNMTTTLPVQTNMTTTLPTQTNMTTTAPVQTNTTTTLPVQTNMTTTVPVQTNQTTTDHQGSCHGPPTEDHFTDHKDGLFTTLHGAGFLPACRGRQGSFTGGDGNIRYYEVSAEKPYIHFLAEYRSLLPQRGMGVMPKRGLDTRQCEIFRFYRLVCVRDLVEPLSFIVPRKSDGFQEDIYPMTAGNEAAMTAQEWLTGQNKGPVLMSLRPSTKVQNPYPAPVDVAGLERSASSAYLSGPNKLFLQEVNQNSEHDLTDLSGWQEDETQWVNTRSTHTQSRVRWCESAAFTPPAAEKELLQVFYSQQEEIRSLREQLEQRDSRIQQLELEMKNIRNQLRASF